MILQWNWPRPLVYRTVEKLSFSQSCNTYLKVCTITMRRTTTCPLFRGFIDGSIHMRPTCALGWPQLYYTDLITCYWNLILLASYVATVVFQLHVVGSGSISYCSNYMLSCWKLHVYREVQCMANYKCCKHKH